jgi:hypothetical protein
MTRATYALLTVLTLAAPAWADRGALSVDVGGGATATLLPSPALAGFRTVRAVTTPTTAAEGCLGLRYALSNDFEVTLAAFYEPSVTVFHNGVTLETLQPPLTQLPGTLRHQLVRHGAQAGARRLWGSVWRIFVGGEVGWERRSNTGFAHLDDRDPAAAFDYRLDLPSTSVDSLVLSAGGGLEWAFADKMSLTVSPRLQLLVGREFTFTATLPVVFSFSWYL